MKTRHRPTRLMLHEAISQNCSTVATALRRRAAMGNSSETPRHSEATTTSMTRVLGAFLVTLCEVEANISLGPFSVRKKDSTFGLFDLVFTRIVASHHFSQTDHMAFSFTFWAPTGSFEKGRLVNLSTNTWTFIPGVAYTKILPQANIELSGIWQLEFYTENPATHFQNGILSDLEALAIKRFKNGFGIGFVESWISAGYGR